MSAKGPPEVEVHAVKECLALVHGIEEADHNILGIVQALQECQGNIQNAAKYYHDKHYSNVPRYCGDDCNGDSTYRPVPSKRRRTATGYVDIASSQHDPTKSTKRFTPNKSNKSTTTTNNKSSSVGSCNKPQGLEGSRKRKPEEGKLLKYYCVIQYMI